MGRPISPEQMPRELTMPRFDEADQRAAPRLAPAPQRDPHLTGPIGANRILVPEGARLQLRHREKDGQWSDYGDVAGAEVELRMVPLKEARRQMERPATTVPAGTEKAVPRSEQKAE